MNDSEQVTRAWSLMANVMDPEIPVLSIVDLGIVRDIYMEGDNLQVLITPTYSGCPAMDAIGMNIRMELAAGGYASFQVIQVLQPAWTTDWMSASGKEKLKAYGIAAPEHSSNSCVDSLFSEEQVACPQCGSPHTRMISNFGSTSCKALYQCEACHEPFDYFKCH